MNNTKTEIEAVDKRDEGQPLISVIVPVYNVEKYLKRCVDSIREQTYKNLEIILVDDGSSDKSGELCDEIALIDKRISVIHKKNSGQASARNVGLDNCNGIYIGFVDSDDWISSDMYEYLYKLIVKFKTEAAQIDYTYASKYPMLCKYRNEIIKRHKDKEVLQNFMTTTTTTGSYSVCRCLFKRSAIGDLKFREGKINEDIDYKYKALLNCHSFAESNQIKYFYYQSTGSTTTSGLRKKDFDLYDAAEELYKLTQNEEYGTIKFLGEVKKARTAFSLLSKIAYYGISDPELELNKKEIIKKLTKEHRKNLPILLKSPMKLSRKIVAILLFINIYTLKFPLKIAKLFKMIQ